MMPRLTPAVKWLMIACGAIYVLELVLVNWVGLESLIPLFALVPERVVHDYWAWQLLTYMWLHHPNDPSHLLFNILGLWLIGATLEQRWGAASFVRFCLLTGFFGGVAVVLGYLIFGDAASGLVLGASGYVDALMIAFGLLYPNLSVWFFGILPLKGKHFVLLLVGLQLLYAAARQDGVSIAAHLGGMAAGALLVTGLWRPSKLRLKLFGPPTPKRTPAPSHLRLVPGDTADDDHGDDDHGDDDHGGNGKSRMLH